jgi:hypothetical protein
LEFQTWFRCAFRTDLALQQEQDFLEYFSNFANVFQEAGDCLPSSLFSTPKTQGIQLKIQDILNRKDRPRQVQPPSGMTMRAPVTQVFVQPVSPIPVAPPRIIASVPSQLQPHNIFPPQMMQAGTPISFVSSNTYNQYMPPSYSNPYYGQPLPVDSEIYAHAYPEPMAYGDYNYMLSVQPTGPVYDEFKPSGNITAFNDNEVSKVVVSQEESQQNSSDRLKALLKDKLKKKMENQNPNS